MDRTNFVDGPILPASWLNRLQGKAEGALEDQSKALLAGEMCSTPFGITDHIGRARAP